MNLWIKTDFKCLLNKAIYRQILSFSSHLLISNSRYYLIVAKIDLHLSAFKVNGNVLDYLVYLGHFLGQKKPWFPWVNYFLAQIGSKMLGFSALLSIIMALPFNSKNCRLVWKQIIISVAVQHQPVSPVNHSGFLLYSKAEKMVNFTTYWLTLQLRPWSFGCIMSVIENHASTSKHL